MGRWYFFIGLGLLILFLLLIFKFRGTLNKIQLNFLTILLLLSVFFYLFKADIMFWYDIALNPATEHRITIDNDNAIYVPLVGETTYDCRDRDTCGSYKTTKPFNKIVNFYEQEEEKNIITSMTVNESEMYLYFEYNTAKIIITYKEYRDEPYNSFTIHVIQ